MIRGIDHIELVVRDVDQFVTFFQRLGFELVRRTEHHGVSAEVKLPGAGQPIFEIHQVQGEENPGLNHIAFACDDIAATYQALRDQEVVFESAPHLIPASGRTVANLRDPDGWRLQLTNPTHLPGS